MERPHRLTVEASIGATGRLRRALQAALLSAGAAVAVALPLPAAAMGPPTPGLAAAGAPSLPGFASDDTMGGLGEPVSYTPLVAAAAGTAENTPLDDTVWLGRTGPLTGTDHLEVSRSAGWPGLQTWRDNTGFATAAPGETRLQGRYGVPLGTVGHLQFHADGMWHDGGPFPAGDTGTRDNRFAHGGLHADMTLSATDALAVLGDLYLGTVADLGDLPAPARPFSGLDDLAGDDGTGLVAGTVRALWSRRLSPTSEIGVQSYLDYAEAGSPRTDARLSTAALAVGHRFTLGSRHDASWGFGYGVFHDQVGTPGDPHADSDSRTYGRFTSYLYDDITLAPDALMLTVGTALAHDDVSGFQAQPSGRLSWRPAGRHALWTSVSRSVRTPSRSAADWADRPATPPASGVSTPFDPDGWAGAAVEEMLAFRAGYAAPPSDGLSFDLAAFYTVYDNVRSLDFGEAETPAVLTGGFAKPDLEDEAYAGDVWGVEATAGWRATDGWTLSAAYALVTMDLRPVGGVDPTAAEAAGRVPVHEGVLRSSFRLHRDLDLDVSFRTVDELAGIGDYVEVGAELSWQPAAGVELSIVGRNLLDDRHPGLGHAIVGAGSLDAESSVSAALRIVF